MEAAASGRPWTPDRLRRPGGPENNRRPEIKVGPAGPGARSVPTRGPQHQLGRRQPLDFMRPAASQSCHAGNGFKRDARALAARRGGAICARGADGAHPARSVLNPYDRRFDDRPAGARGARRRRPRGRDLLRRLAVPDGRRARRLAAGLASARREQRRLSRRAPNRPDEPVGDLRAFPPLLLGCFFAEQIALASASRPSSRNAPVDTCCRSRR